MECFQEKKTLQQGLQKLFDELNSDTNGFWNFQVVNDPYIAGNVKVIDTKQTLMDPVDYLEQNKDANLNKVDKGMFVFESWGDRSIIKAQKLSAELPSSFAVTAMYAGTAKPGTERTQGDNDSAMEKKVVMVKTNPNSILLNQRNYQVSLVKMHYKLEEGDLSGESTKNKFGVDKGIEFDLIDWTELIEKYQDETKKNSDGKKEKDKKIDERKRHQTS